MEVPQKTKIDSMFPRTVADCSRGISNSMREAAWRDSDSSGQCNSSSGHLPFLYFKEQGALASETRWECHPVHQRVEGSIPSGVTYGRQPINVAHIDISLSQIYKNFLKNENRTTTWSSSLTAEYVPKGNEISIRKDERTPVFTTALSQQPRRGNNQVCVSG